MKKEEIAVPGKELGAPLIGISQTIKNQKKMIPRWAESNMDMLIIGEYGSGRRTLVRTIVSHIFNTRGEIPFSSANLSVIPEKDLDPVLFGYDRLAERFPYTTKKGLFEIGGKGIILLEELDEMAITSQKRLAEFLCTRESARIGSKKPQSVDVRVFVTVKASPAELLAAKKILPALSEELSKMEKIEIPPLRERHEDFPLLLEYYIEQICLKLGIPLVGYEPRHVEVLAGQEWKENIKEFRAFIEQVIAFSKGNQFTLPDEIYDEKTEIVKMINAVNEGESFILDKSLDRIEKGVIEKVLVKMNKNQSRTAHFLGMTEQTLRYKVRRLGIETGRRKGWWRR